jgi:GT2 family glycosyltransferase
MLASVLRQTPCDQEYEIIVIDNAGEADPATAGVCRAKSEEGLTLRCVHHPVAGASGARNRGIAEARAEFVAFLDDDVILPDEWLKRALAIRKSPGVDVYGGPFVPYYNSPRPRWFRDSYVSGTWGESARWLEGREYLFGMNIVWKKSILETLGGFSIRFGPGTPYGYYGEETELQARARRKGVRIWYDPTLVLDHYVHPDRMRVSWLLGSRWEHGKAKARIDLANVVHEDRRPRGRLVATWLRSTARHAFRLALMALEMPLRRKDTYPRYQNFLVEKVGPELSGMSADLHLAALLAKQNSGEEGTPR